MPPKKKLRISAADTMASSTADGAEQRQQPSMVHDPIDLLNSLTTSISSLRDSVSQLRTKNEDLRKELRSVSTDLVTLQENCGMKFLLFKQLPAELGRCILTLLSLNFSVLGSQLASQDYLAICMLSFSDSHPYSRTASRSQINSVINSCEEVRTVAENHSARLLHIQ